MDKRLHIAVLFGGRSHEHQISLLSAYQVMQSVKEDYILTSIGIDKEGQWRRYPLDQCFIHPENPEAITLSSHGTPVDPFLILNAVDVVFPVLHGPLGEDGAVQGMCKMANIPCIGSDVLGSAIGMDKEVTKRLLIQANIPTAPYVLVRNFQEIKEEAFASLTFPLFVKPCNGGSSFGVTKVASQHALLSAIKKAFCYDEKVLVEEAIVGREIHLGVLGEQEPRVSLGCEIRPRGEYHSYASKYIDPQGAEFIYPAEVEMGLYLKMRRTALQTYQVLELAPMARVDLFLTNSGQVFVNEVNTIPGLTKTSPFAKIWEISGVSFKELTAQLVDAALKRHRRQVALYAKEEAQV